MAKKRGGLVKISTKGLGKFAKPASEAIGLASGTGKFLAQFIRPPLKQAVGMLTDELAYRRWERQQRLALRALAFMKEKGLKTPTRPLPANIALPLLAAATLEENDEMQDVWARLLVNGADAREPEIRHAYISILESLTPLDARLLNSIHSASLELGQEAVWAGALPERAITSKMREALTKEEQERLPVLSDANHEAIWNLIRLGCVTGETMWDSISASWVVMTPLGAGFVKACTIKPQRAPS
jgi:hypothetical protein